MELHQVDFLQGMALIVACRGNTERVRDFDLQERKGNETRRLTVIRLLLRQASVEDRNIACNEKQETNRRGRNRVEETHN